MTENQKAAIAAGLWEPGREAVNNPLVPPAKQAELKEKFNLYVEEQAPDMHDPANLWRALENLPKSQRMGALVRMMDCEDGQKLGDYAFAALVAIYDAEHPHG